MNKLTHRYRARQLQRLTKHPVFCAPRRSCLLAMLAVVMLCFTLSGVLHAQGNAEFLPSVGDAPPSAPPLAIDLSPALTKHNVGRAIAKVAEWQLGRAEPGFDQDWTFAALYAGFMAVPDEAGGRKYRDAMLRMGKKFAWKPAPNLNNANDLAIGQTYLDLYRETHDPVVLSPIRSRIDAQMLLRDNKKKPLWWWCDSLFMEPPVLARLYAVTGERKYLDFMDRQWWITSNLLYSKTDHLFARDRSFLYKHQANGKSVYWSRGNGWVIAGLARVLSDLPVDYPSRPKYVAQFRQMAEEIASIQGSDGLWRPGLLDPDAYQLPEVSGSAFFTYALAYGVESGILDRQEYLPVVKRAWAGLIAHIFSDGRLGCIQPVADSPGVYPATASYVFGTGAFFLAGSEVYRLAQ